MIRTILKLGIFIVAILVGYNYFFGNPEEKAQSRELVGKVGDLGKDAWNLLKVERQKMREGKYDDALEKLEGLYGSLRDQAERVRDSDALRRLNELNDRRRELERELSADGDELSGDAKRKLEDLTADTEDLMNEMEAQGQSTAPR